MKYLLISIIAALVIIVGGISLYLAPDGLRRCKQPEPTGSCAAADAIVALSGGDTNARADEAIKLYNQGWAQKLIFSGAAADSSGPSNAAAMSRRAVAAGVPESAIMVDELSRDTAENAINTSKFITEHAIGRLILVTSAYHQRRASLEFHAILPQETSIVNHPVARDKQWAGPWWWTTARGWWLAGGELVKIAAFYTAKGASGI